MTDADDRLLESPPGPEVVVGGERFLYFGGTSYLGLHADPEVIAAAARALTRHGLHAATSRSGFGETPPLRASEAALARFFATEDALHFASGFGGVSVLMSAADPGWDVVLLDEHTHWSGLDAAARGGRRVETFAHRDADALREALRSSGARRPAVVTDGVFAATGRIAPLGDLVRVLEEHGQADLLVDDAHGFGVLGENGRGTCEHHRLIGVNTDRAHGVRVFVCGTTSKALGGFGGAIAGERAFLDRARERSHWFDGASPPPAPAAAAVAAAIAVLEREPERRAALRARADRLRSGLAALGLDVEPAPTPVVAVLGRKASELQRIAARLRERGILVPFMRYAGLPPDGALRIAVFATHLEEHVDRLLTELAAAL